MEEILEPGESVCVPAIRFMDFETRESLVWKQTKLGEVATFSKGKGISKADISGSGVFECIRYGELYTTYQEVITEVVSKTNLAEAELVFSEIDDVLIPSSGETALDIAIAAVVPKEGIAIGGDINIIRSTLDGRFLAYYLRSKKRVEIAKLAQGNSVVHLYAQQLGTISINFPSLPEQQKIASFLSAVDEKIQLLKRKKELLEQYKKGVMQQLFSGKLRFKDENGVDFPDWEEKKLGEVATFVKGKGIAKSDVVASGINPCIRYGELYTTYGECIEEVVSKTDVRLEDSVVSEINDVIIPSSGETPIDIATAACVLKDNVILGGDLNIIRTKIDGIFLSYYLNNKKREAIAKLAQGNAVVHLYSSQLSKLRIELPIKEEQTKIASFVRSIDKKIRAIDKQITLTQTFKKGLLQQMFV